MMLGQLRPYANIALSSMYILREEFVQSFILCSNGDV